MQVGTRRRGGDGGERAEASWKIPVARACSGTRVRTSNPAPVFVPAADVVGARFQEEAHIVGRRRGGGGRRRPATTPAERRSAGLHGHADARCRARGRSIFGKKRKSTGEATPGRAAMPPTMTKARFESRRRRPPAELVGARFSGKRRASGNGIGARAQGRRRTGGRRGCGSIARGGGCAGGVSVFREEAPSPGRARRPPVEGTKRNPHDDDEDARFESRNADARRRARRRAIFWKASQVLPRGRGPRAPFRRVRRDPRLRSRRLRRPRRPADPFVPAKRCV